MEHTGKYLMAEVMNISSIGPNSGPFSNIRIRVMVSLKWYLFLKVNVKRICQGYISHKINGEEKDIYTFDCKG